MSKFGEISTDVLGINPASIDSHRKYAKRFNFNFPIISDADKTICKLYGALDGDRVVRTVYIVSPTGEIIYAKKGMPDNKELLETIKQHKTFPSSTVCTTKNK